MRLRLSIHVLLVILFHMALARPALANMAKPSEQGEVAGILEPETEGAVRVDGETLSFDVAEDLATARVKAVYKMTSTAAAPASFDVAFVHVAGDSAPDPHAAPATVLVDGQPVAFRTEHGGAGKRARGWSELAGFRQLGFLIFHLDFAPGQTRGVEVAYTQIAGWDRRINVHTTYTFEYLLSPAAHWASFGPLDVQVRVPNGTRFTSPSPGFTAKGDLHTASFATLPPGELTFSVMPTRGLWFGLASTDAYGIILIIAQATAALAIGVATGGRWQGSGCKLALARIFGAGFLGGMGAFAVAILALAIFPGHGLGYGGFFLGVGLSILAAPLCVVASFLSARSRLRPLPPPPAF